MSPGWLLFMSICSSFSGEVSDSESNSSSSSSDSDSSEDEVFKDGYDDDLMGDAEDRARLEQMTEKEREQELFNRIEKREVLKRRWEEMKKWWRSLTMLLLRLWCTHPKLLICWQVWNQEETENGKEEGERGEKEEARGRARKTETISGSRHTSGESWTRRRRWTCSILCWCAWMWLYFPWPFLQVTSHNKERRSKRDEKLDKKSQAMEELKAEREKKKNKTGVCAFVASSLLCVCVCCCYSESNSWLFFSPWISWATGQTSASENQWSLLGRRGGRGGRRRQVVGQKWSEFAVVIVRWRRVSVIVVVEIHWLHIYLFPVLNFVTFVPTEKRRLHQSHNQFHYQRNWTGSVCPETSWSAGVTCPSLQRP